MKWILTLLVIGIISTLMFGAGADGSPETREVIDTLPEQTLSDMEMESFQGRLVKEVFVEPTLEGTAMIGVKAYDMGQSHSWINGRIVMAVGPWLWILASVAYLLNSLRSIRPDLFEAIIPNL